MRSKKQWFPQKTQCARRLSQWLIAVLALILPIQAPMQFVLRAAPVYAATVNPADLKGAMWSWRKWRTSTGYNWVGMENDLKEISSGGIGWVRIDLSEGTPLTVYDQLIPLIAKYHIKVLGLLLKSYPTKDLGTVAQQTAYRAWLTKVVTRYKGTVLVWEVQNEPDIHQSWNIDEKTSDPAAYAHSVANYVSLLKQAYTTIKAVDPTQRVMLGGLSEWTSERYVGELINQNAYQYFDILGYHPYARSPLAVAARVKSIRAKMALQPALAAKPIWITEIGFNTEQSWSTAGIVATDAIKADFLLQTIQLLSEIPGVQRPIFWYTFVEQSSSAGFGLVREDVTKTPVQIQFLPAYTAYKSLWVTKFVRIMPASEDSFVSRNYPTANYGSANILRIGHGSDVREAFLKFDLTGLAGTTLQQVQLGFLVSGEVDAGSAPTQTVQMLTTTSWTESGIKNVNQLTPVVGYIGHTVQAHGYQVALDTANIQRATGGSMSLEISSQYADELVIRSREWASEPPRLIIYYAPAVVSAAAVEQGDTPSAEALEAIQMVPAAPENEMIDIQPDSGDAGGWDHGAIDAEPSPNLYLPDVQR